MCVEPESGPCAAARQSVHHRVHAWSVPIELFIIYLYNAMVE